MIPWIDTIINILINAGLVEGLFLVVLLRKAKQKPSKANIWLSILLIVMSVSIIHSFYISPTLSKLLNNPFKITEPGILLISPLLWFYVQSLVNKDFKFKPILLINFIPYAILYFMFIPIMHDLGLDSYVFFLHKFSFLGTLAVWITILIQFAFYFRKIIIMSKLHHKKVEEELSNPEGFDIDWIKYFVSVFFGLYVFLVILFLWFIHTGNDTNFPSFISLAFAVAIFFLGYKGLFQKEFQIIPLPDFIENNMEIEMEKVESNKISDNTIKFQTYIEKLKLYLEKEKPYLNCELTLSMLAQGLQMSRNNLSEVINSGMNENFYNLINRYRVEEVKELMNNLKLKNYTILAIAYEAGFASKATFNTIFKKFTGLTPSEYRNRLV